MPGPYTAFTYGDPGAVNTFPNTPTMTEMERLLFGLPLGASYAPVPVGQKLQGGVIGIAYSEAITTNGGTAPYVYTLVSGTLPAGLSLNNSTGLITGTPTTATTYTFTILVTDGSNNTGSETFSITIAASGGGGGGVSNYGFIG